MSTSLSWKHGSRYTGQRGVTVAWVTFRVSAPRSAAHGRPGKASTLGRYHLISGVCVIFGDVIAVCVLLSNNAN